MGSYRPGEFLPTEATLMSQYGVGRPSAREALRLLESDGVIRVVRGHTGGAEVLAPDPKSLARRAGYYLQLKGADLADIRAARDLVDPGAVALAAHRRDPDDIAALRAIVERVRVCRSGVEFGEIAADFVEALLVASGNHTLSLFALMIDRLLRQEFHRYTDQVTGWPTGERAAHFARRMGARRRSHRCRRCGRGRGGLVVAPPRRRPQQDRSGRTPSWCTRRPLGIPIQD